MALKRNHPDIQRSVVIEGLYERHCGEIAEALGEWVAGAVRGDSNSIEDDNTRKAKRLAAP